MELIDLNGEIVPDDTPIEFIYGVRTNTSKLLKLIPVSNSLLLDFINRYFLDSYTTDDTFSRITSNISYYLGKYNKVASEINSYLEDYLSIYLWKLASSTDRNELLSYKLPYTSQVNIIIEDLNIDFSSDKDNAILVELIPKSSN